MNGTYEPPTVEIGSPCSFGAPVLAEGVTGYAVEKDGKIYIPLVTAIRQGSGDVGRFIDSLSSRCVFANVCSPRLQGMLRRRGYVETIEFDHEYGESFDVWSKAANALSSSVPPVDASVPLVSEIDGAAH